MLVIINEVSQFQVIKIPDWIKTTCPVVFVEPDVGTEPVPVQPVARQLTPEVTTDGAVQVIAVRHE